MAERSDSTAAAVDTNRNAVQYHSAGDAGLYCETPLAFVRVIADPLSFTQIGWPGLD